MVSSCFGYPTSGTGASLIKFTFCSHILFKGFLFLMFELLSSNQCFIIRYGDFDGWNIKQL